MKRLFAWIGVALLAALLSLVGIVVASFSGLAPIQDGRRVDGVEVVKDRFVACYIIDLADGAVALVDACGDPTAGAILSALARRGLGPDAVKAILLTHGDYDHVRGAIAFPAAQVLVLGPDRALAEGRETRLPRWLGKKVATDVPVTRALSDGEVVELAGGSFRVLAVPGHTRGSAAFLARGVLFMGDSSETASGGSLAPAKRLTSVDTKQNRASLVRLSRRLAPSAGDVKVIAPAHSGLLEKGLGPLIEWAQGEAAP